MIHVCLLALIVGIWVDPPFLKGIDTLSEQLKETFIKIVLRATFSQDEETTELKKSDD